MVKSRLSFGLEFNGLSHKHAWSLDSMEQYHTRTHIEHIFGNLSDYFFAGVAEIDFNRYF